MLLVGKKTQSPSYKMLARERTEDFSPELPSKCGLIEIDGKDNRVRLIEFYS